MDVVCERATGLPSTSSSDSEESVLLSVDWVSLRSSKSSRFSWEVVISPSRVSISSDPSWDGGRVSLGSAMGPAIWLWVSY